MIKNKLNTLQNEELYLKNTYNRRFKQFENELKSRQEMWKELVVSYFQQFVSENDVIVDIPCGYGEFSMHIKAKTKIGIDLNPDSKKYLSKDVQFIQSSSDNLKLKANSVDVIFVSNYFEHISHPVLHNTLLEFHRVLKTNGKVMVLQPNIRFITNDYWMFFDHINPVDDRALDEIFEICGMKLVKKIEKFLPYTTKSRLPNHRWLIKLYLKVPLIWKIFGKQSFIIYTKA